jgi:hypothetical protein
MVRYLWLLASRINPQTTDVILGQVHCLAWEHQLLICD